MSITMNKKLSKMETYVKFHEDMRKCIISIPKMSTTINEKLSKMETYVNFHEDMRECIISIPTRY